MSNVATRYKLVIGVIIFLLLCSVPYYCKKISYLTSYRTLDLELVMKFEYNLPKNQTKPYWISVDKEKSIDVQQREFNCVFPKINLNDEMLIISVGSELEQMKYNLLEDSFRKRGSYIGFPYFADKNAQNVVYVYKTTNVPLIDNDVAGTHPNYRGEWENWYDLHPNRRDYTKEEI